MNENSETSLQPVHRVAVLGAGVMGRAIAAHLANTGFGVLLLDLPPAEAPPRREEPATGSGSAGTIRDRLAREAIVGLARTRPAPLFLPGLARRIEAGNLEDDLPRLAEVDWVIEAVVERLDVKKSLFERVAEHVRPSTVLSTNTSGIPMRAIAESLPARLRPRFLGTHFFNPPRYMHLLELVPGPDTDPGLVDALRQLAEERLGKGVVIAKDRPNFIANRIGTYGLLRAVQLMDEHGLGVEAVDLLTGPFLGRPKSATFRTVDLVGLDVVLHVAGNIREAAPDDPQIEIFTPHPVLQKMVDEGLLGTKAGGGFYRKVKTDQGPQIETLDLATLHYRARQKARFPEIDALRNQEDLRARLGALVTTEGKGAAYAAALLVDTLRYAAEVAGEIADDLASIDRAMRWGFGWKLGPFETWDALGMAAVAETMERQGAPPPRWVQQHLASGASSFYVETAVEGRAERATLALDGEGLTAVPRRPAVLRLRPGHEGPRRIEGNAGASLWDLGDGALGLEFHSKMNSLGGDAMTMAAKACARAEREFEAMVVANEGETFSVGANVALLLLAAVEGEYDEIDLMVRQFQRMTMGLRRCTRPVAVAPFGLTLGGGVEITLHGDAACASAEVYMGLVEAGVGLVPAGGGTKEFYLRMLDGQGPGADPRRAAQRAFETIGLGKVSTSALEARELGFLSDRDQIVPNPDRLVASAKARALALARSGYAPPAEREDVPVGGADTLALLEVGLHNYRAAGQISEHDARIGRKLAGILSGGAHRTGAPPHVVSEQQLLDLEREAFLSLCGERKTLERIQHMLKTGKPLRN